MEQLGFDLEVERLVRVTPARLGVWDDCPRRYRLTYLDRPPPPRGGPQAANTLGAVVHLALRAVFELPVAERTGPATAALVDRYWSSEGFRDGRQAADYRALARDWVADYVTDAVAGTEPDEELAVGLEQWVSVSTGRVGRGPVTASTPRRLSCDADTRPAGNTEPGPTGGSTALACTRWPPRARGGALPAGSNGPPARNDRRLANDERLAGAHLRRAGRPRQLTDADRSAVRRGIGGAVPDRRSALRGCPMRRSCRRAGGGTARRSVGHAVQCAEGWG